MIPELTTDSSESLQLKNIRNFQPYLSLNNDYIIQPTAADKLPQAQKPKPQQQKLKFWRAAPT